MPAGALASAVILVAFPVLSPVGPRVLSHPWELYS